jgi:hypothetical protein
MNILAIPLTTGTLLLVGSQMLFGFWIAAKAVTPEGVNFHRNLGIGTAVFIVATVLIMVGMLLTR